MIYSLGKVHWHQYISFYLALILPMTHWVKFNVPSAPHGQYYYELSKMAATLAVTSNALSCPRYRFNLKRTQYYEPDQAQLDRYLGLRAIHTGPRPCLNNKSKYRHQNPNLNNSTNSAECTMRLTIIFA